MLEKFEAFRWMLHDSPLFWDIVMCGALICFGVYGICAVALLILEVRKRMEEGMTLAEAYADLCIQEQKENKIQKMIDAHKAKKAEKKAAKETAKDKGTNPWNGDF